MLYISLLNNITLLVSLSVIHSFLTRYYATATRRYQILSGILFGIVAVIGMINSVKLSPGIVFDGRSIILATAGIFGGPLTAGISVVISAAYRLSMGGEGTIMGVAVIMESALLGTLLFYLRKRSPRASGWLPLLVTGVVVHLIMLLLTVTLPGGFRNETLPQIFFPVLIIYPIATLLVGLLFRGDETHREVVRKLSESEAKYRLLIHNQSDMVVKIDNEGRFQYVSPTYCDMFGKTEDELVGRNFIPLVHEDDRDSTVRMMEELGHPPHTVYIEQRAMTRHGWRWLAWSDTAILDEKGDIKEIIGVGRDISEKKIFDQELIAAKTRAEESDKLKTAFLNNLSHEIRTPLNAIMGFTELIISYETTTEERRRFSEIVSRSGNQLLSLIDDILDMASIEAGEVKVSFSQTNINKVLEHVYNQVSMNSEAPGTTIEFVGLPDDKALVITDELRLIQILNNLAGNAVKFSRGGKVILRCTESGDDLLFEVEDNGIGIPPEMQDKIFERFVQVDNTITREFGGTGLGLSITKSLVGLLGGRIWMESELGIGSRFYFTISGKQS